MHDKELEQHQDRNEVSFSDNPDYLQEKSDIINSLNASQKIEEQGALDDRSYSEKYEIQAKNHMAQVEESLAKARSNGDYGSPEIAPNGEQIKGDMPFLEEESKIPEDLKKEM